MLLIVRLSGQGVPAVDFNHLDEYFANMVEEWGLPSASIGIVKNGDLVFTGNYGYPVPIFQFVPDWNNFIVHTCTSAFRPNICMNFECKIKYC